MGGPTNNSVSHIFETSLRIIESLKPCSFQSRDYIVDATDYTRDSVRRKKKTERQFKIDFPPLMEESFKKCKLASFFFFFFFSFYRHAPPVSMYSKIQRVMNPEEVCLATRL